MGEAAIADRTLYLILGSAADRIPRDDGHTVHKASGNAGGCAENYGTRGGDRNRVAQGAFAECVQCLDLVGIGGAVFEVLVAVVLLGGAADTGVLAAVGGTVDLVLGRAGYRIPGKVGGAAGHLALDTGRLRECALRGNRNGNRSAEGTLIAVVIHRDNFILVGCVVKNIIIDELRVFNSTNVGECAARKSAIDSVCGCIGNFVPGDAGLAVAKASGHSGRSFQTVSNYRYRCAELALCAVIIDCAQLIVIVHKADELIGIDEVGVVHSRNEFITAGALRAAVYLVARRILACAPGQCGHTFLYERVHIGGRFKSVGSGNIDRDRRAVRTFDIVVRSNYLIVIGGVVNDVVVGIARIPSRAAEVVGLTRYGAIDVVAGRAVDSVPSDNGLAVFKAGVNAVGSVKVDRRGSGSGGGLGRRLGSGYRSGSGLGRRLGRGLRSGIGNYGTIRIGAVRDSSCAGFPPQIGLVVGVNVAHDEVRIVAQHKVGIRFASNRILELHAVVSAVVFDIPVDPLGSAVIRVKAPKGVRVCADVAAGRFIDDGVG